MRKTLIMAVAALVIATPALADEWDFVLINSTAKAIKLVELAPTGTTEYAFRATQSWLIKASTSSMN